MRKRNKEKHGFTLAELSIVLAVIAIVTTMVVSFTSLVGNRRAESQARLDALNDIKVAEAAIEAYIEKNGTSDNIKFDQDGKVLTVGTNSITLDRVTNITFNTQTFSNDTIYFCTVEYTLPRQAENEYYTFCVNPYVGETIEGGN